MTPSIKLGRYNVVMPDSCEDADLTSVEPMPVAAGTVRAVGDFLFKSVDSWKAGWRKFYTRWDLVDNTQRKSFLRSISEGLL